MKMIFTLIVLWTAAGALLVAAPVSASLKVDGLTCSLCNRSVHEAVTKLDFIDTVAADLANASFTLTFKPGQEIRVRPLSGCQGGEAIAVDGSRVARSCDRPRPGRSSSLSER